MTIAARPETVTADKLTWEFRDSLTENQIGIAEGYLIWRGKAFRVFRASNGRLNCSMTSGPGDFLGYVDTIEEAADRITARYN